MTARGNGTERLKAAARRSPSLLSFLLDTAASFNDNAGYVDISSDTSDRTRRH
jgi:hypothetical protein